MKERSVTKRIFYIVGYVSAFSLILAGIFSDISSMHGLGFSYEPTDAYILFAFGFILLVIVSIATVILEKKGIE